MKNKWLLILFIIFLGVIVLSLLITQQSQKAVSLAEKEISIAEQAESKIPPVDSVFMRQAPTKPLPLVRSGITIIKAPLSQSEEKSIHVSQTADQAANKVSGRNVVASSAPDAETQDSPQTGITKTGKQPTPKEAQEMNSSGIILY